MSQTYAVLYKMSRYSKLSSALKYHQFKVGFLSVLCFCFVILLAALP